MLSASATLLFGLPCLAQSTTFSDVTSKTYEKSAITTVISKGWMAPASPTTFGYGTPVSPSDWLHMLMFLRTSDACPELGLTPNRYWTDQNISACLAGAGVPVQTEEPQRLRRDEAMQQLFALRRRSFAFQQLQTKPAGYLDPSDLASIPTNRQGAMIAADRLKLLFRTKNALLPASPLLREDAALAVTRFTDWEQQGGVDGESNDQKTLSAGTTLNHWRDLDTDIYVVQMKGGGDAEIKPILPRRSFNPASATSTTKLRDEYVYEPVSTLAQETGAVAAINGSYFNVQWPWGALEDVAIVDGKTLLSRTDRSTFVVCKDGTMSIGTFTTSTLQAIHCTPTQALGAGPLFMTGGEILTASTKEGFDEYTQWERRVGKNARTAVALSKDRKTAYFIVVAGKSYPAFGRGGNSLGTFLISKYPDISDAMMYDGGGSSDLYAGGNLLVGSGISGATSERSVVSALGIFSKKAEATAAKAFKKEQLLRWDNASVALKTTKPTSGFPWQNAKQAKSGGVSLSLSGARGSTVQIMDPEDHVQIFNLTFDLVAQNATSSLTLTRREGTDENGWKIPTEIHILNAKDGSDTDVIRLFQYMPASQQPDLKTFDAITFTKTGVVFGDATGRTWLYYAKDTQLSPAKFAPPAKPKPAKKAPVKKKKASS